MTEQEIAFKSSIERKIAEYEIKTDLKTALSYYNNKFTNIKYNDGKTDKWYLDKNDNVFKNLI